MAVVVFRRPQRVEPPSLPAGVLELRSPPSLPERVSGSAGQWLMMLPMLSGAGVMAFMFAGSGGRSTNVASSVMFAMSSVGMGAMGFSRMASGEHRRRLSAERRDYMRHLAQVRRKARDAASGQRDALQWLHPEPFGLLTLARSSRLWERRPSDTDFVTVRLGCGPQELAARLQLPDLAPLEDLEPLTAAALHRFIQVHGSVENLPVAVALRSFARVLVSGEHARALVRALVAQLVTWHAPGELRLALCVDEAGAREWDWAKWLPHAAHPDRQDATGPVRLVASGMAEVEGLLADDLSGRGWFAADAEPLADRAHVVVVVDGGQSSDAGQLSISGLAGVTVIDVSAVFAAAPEVSTLQLRVTGSDVFAVETDRLGQEVSTNVAAPDLLSRAEAAELARALAPVRLPGGGEPDQQSPPSALMDLLGVADLRTLTPTGTAGSRSARERLSAVLGVGADGLPVELDIKEAAAGGMGPHGLVVGATGSGKSELLRTLVIGLAITHSPQELNFVLVDFKGGATFRKLDRLPHTSAVITNLAGELVLVERMADALSGEVTRRQEALRAAGNYDSVRDYETARAGGARLEAMPTLLVVVDEFSELLAAKPDFIDLFVTVGRVGRSLGIHLLLASQRLEEGKLHGLDTYLSYRIGLRTFSAAESRVVLGVPDAYELPTAPGNGYLRHGTEALTRFKAAYVSGPYRGVSSRPQPLPTEVAQPVWFGLVTQAHQVSPREASGWSVPTKVGREPTVLDTVVDGLAGHGRPARQVWLPPLKDPASLDSLLPALVKGEARGLGASGPLAGTLRVPVGLIDKPFEQRRDTLWADFSGSAGHAAIVGAPQTGKSTLVRSIIAALTLTHTPTEVQAYALDFGGGSLAGMSGLPHVGAIAGRGQIDLVRRTIAMAERIIECREESFTAHGLDSAHEWRAAVRSGRVPGDGHGDVFVVVDGWGVLRENFDDLEAAITSIAARGLSYGVHVIIAATRWAELRPAVRDLLGTRFELRLGDPMDSQAGAKTAALIPHTPGRGITAHRLHFLAAVPRIDGVHSANGLAEALSDLVDSVANGWAERPTAAQVPVLPPKISYTDLRARSDSEAGVPLGLDENLAPLYWVPHRDQHLLVFGDIESGKTTLLRTLAAGIKARYQPGHAKFLLLDPRRGLLDAIGDDWSVATLVAPNQATAALREAAAAIGQRVPGPDISAARLADRDWWSGPEMFVLIDDYEQSAPHQPLDPLLPLLGHARDVGLHLIVARAARGATRALFDPNYQRLRDAGPPAMVLSSPPDEGPILGRARVTTYAPGRGRWVTRRGSEFLCQVAQPPSTHRNR